MTVFSLSKYSCHVKYIVTWLVNLTCIPQVTSETDVIEAFQKCEAAFGKINGLVNCAGIAHRIPVFNTETKEVHSLEAFRKILDVSLSKDLSQYIHREK